MITSVAEKAIEALARSLDVSEARYASADRSYKSVCAWLERDESRFASSDIKVYTQGSFRLGTAIRPVDAAEHYDLDIVCEFGRSKLSCTQARLHADLGNELTAYAERYGMDKPEPWQRCWTLNYADGAQFHMDVLPSVPDGVRQRRLLEQASLSVDYADEAVSITDSEHRNFRILSDDWPSSNPNGYANWFYARMKPVFESLRKSMMLAEAKADVAEIPEYRVKTPLQSAIQILKHHRDVHFADSDAPKPASIIITTLAAHAYQQEATISGALLSILERMDAYIEVRGGRYWIVNPSDPRENFADFWDREPNRREAFFEWLEAARADFERASLLADQAVLREELAKSVGGALAERAVPRDAPSVTVRSSGLPVALRNAGSALQKILGAPHRKSPQWPVVAEGRVTIETAVHQRNGFAPKDFKSGDPVPRAANLRFQAKTNVERPYKVFWQIVNTGTAATDARDLRGGFEEVTVEAGKLTRQETATYPGTHSIECFIVRNGYCVARSHPFIVEIR